MEQIVVALCRSLVATTWGARAGAAIIIRGQYYAPGQPVTHDDTKLHPLIDGPTLQVVKHAKALIKEIIEDKTEKSMRREAGAMGRFQIA